MRKLTLVLVLLAAGSVRAADPAPDVRGTVEKSLGFIDKAGAAWIKEKKCVTCHHVPFQLWSQRLGSLHGFNVDAKVLAERSEWAVDFVIAARDKKGQPNGHGVDTLTHLILGRDPVYAADKMPEKTTQMVELLSKLQNEDGSWSAGGQLPDQKRPKPETQAVTTLWTVLALGSLDATDEVAERQARAVRWLRSSSGQTTEYLAVRILYEIKFGAREQADVLVAQLKQEQNADGGWGWEKGKPSDALATGITLFALGRARLGDKETIARARTFLVKTQQPDGSWLVPSTKGAKSPVIAQYWGTAWGTIGLLESQPRQEFARKDQPKSSGD